MRLSIAIAGCAASALMMSTAWSQDAPRNTFTTAVEADTTAPTFASAPRFELVGGAPTLMWQTDKVADTRIRVGLSPQQLNRTGINAEFVRDHSIRIGGVVADQTYYYQVISIDPAGNVVESDVQTFYLPSPVVEYLLTLNLTGDGFGWVGDGTFNCVDSCSVLIEEDSEVVLNAQAEDNSYFMGWASDAVQCNGIGDCVFTMDSDVTIDAEFILLSNTDPEPIEIPIFEAIVGSEYAESDPIVIQGLDGPVLIQIESGEFSINCTGEWTTEPTLLYPGDTICIRHAVSGDAGTEYTTVMWIGGYRVEFVSVVVAPSAERRRSRLLLRVIPVVLSQLED